MKYKIIVPADVLPYPEAHEISAAGILAGYFNEDVVFIKRTANKTADIRVSDADWEIKSPTGKGKYNIQHQFQKAAKQSPNVVFDARRSKIHINKISREVDRQFKLSRSLKRLILIKKDGKIVAFNK